LQFTISVFISIENKFALAMRMDYLKKNKQ
jgi:hypothetical protein